MGLFGFGKKKEAKIFNRHYYSLLSKINKIPGAKNASFELLPAMFVICDYASASAHKDRRIVADNILEEINSLERELNTTTFDNRVDLYGQVLRGKPLRCEWLLFNSSGWKDNPVMTITAVLADILYNPACADDYDNAPALLSGIDVSIGFAAGIEPVLDEFVALFREIYDL